VRERFGLYKTIGWDTDTWSPTQGIGGEELFLEDMTFGEDKYQQIMEGLLADGDADLYVQIFYFTDRIGHLFWRYLDGEASTYDAVAAAKWAPRCSRPTREWTPWWGRPGSWRAPRRCSWSAPTTASPPSAAG
jgi:hypothetical protein